MKTYRIITSILQRLVWLPTRLTFNFFCHFEIIGIQNIRVGKNAIFASNHISELDPILIAACLPFWSHHLPLFYTSREKDFYKNKRGWKKFLYGGSFFNAWGAYQVYIGIRNYERSLANHLQILRDCCSICIFPEGKRNSENEFLKAKGGVAFLAHRIKLPVIPVAIQGSEKTMVSDFFLRRKRIHVIFGEPLYAKDLFTNPDKVTLNESRNEYEEAAALIMKKVRTMSLQPLASLEAAKRRAINTIYTASKPGANIEKDPKPLPRKLVPEPVKIENIPRNPESRANPSN